MPLKGIDTRKEGGKKTFTSSGEDVSDRRYSGREHVTGWSWWAGLEIYDPSLCEELNSTAKKEQEGTDMLKSLFYYHNLMVITG